MIEMSNIETFIRWFGQEDAASTATHALYRTSAGELVVLRSSMDAPDGLWMWSNQVDTPINGIESDFSANTNRAPKGFPICDLVKMFGKGLRMHRATTGSALERLLQSIQAPSVEEQKPEYEITKDFLAMTPFQPTNVILYGPPGTGKTYSTVLKAMSMVDGLEYGMDVEPTQYDLLKQRFDALKTDDQIEFITFHQSYGYEDFMQGIRPFTENGQVAYEVRDGVLKRIAEKALLNWTRSNNASPMVVDDDSSFQSALLSLQEKMETAVDQKVPMTLYGGATTRVSLRPDGKVLEFNVPSTGNPWSVTIKKLRALWSKRNEIQVPSDTGGFNGSYWWAALNLLKQNFNESEKLASVQEPLKQYVLVIDEINRGNISKIFGELITLVESDKRIGARYETRVTLPYADMEDEPIPFGLPMNLHLVGTMNTADRSIALLDTALRRRFQFEELMPRPELLRTDMEGINLRLLLQKLNERIEILYDRDHTIGHAYLMDVATLNQLEQAFRHRILPLLQEYFYENWSKVRVVLNDIGGGDFVRKVEQPALAQDGDEGYESDARPISSVNFARFSVVAYKRIYGA